MLLGAGTLDKHGSTRFRFLLQCWVVLRYGRRHWLNCTARCCETLGQVTLLIFDSFRVGFARQVASLSD